MIFFFSSSFFFFSFLGERERKKHKSIVWATECQVGPPPWAPALVRSKYPMVGTVEEGALRTEDIRLLYTPPLRSTQHPAASGWHDRQRRSHSPGGHPLLQGYLARREWSSPHAHP